MPIHMGLGAVEAGFTLEGNGNRVVAYSYSYTSILQGCGILTYIDANENIYDPQDVYQNKPNPRRIHKYKKDIDDNYTIIDL